MTRRTLLQDGAALSAALVLPVRTLPNTPVEPSAAALTPARRATYAALHRALAAGSGAPLAEAEAKGPVAAFAARYGALDDAARLGVDVLLDSMDEPGAVVPFRSLDRADALAHIRRRARDHRPYAGRGAPRSSLMHATVELIEASHAGGRSDLGARLGET
jgi:hypothetical protein